MTRLERIEGLIQSLWPKFVAAQGAEFLQRGRYWQGMATHDEALDSESPVVERRLAGLKTWREFLPDLPAVLDVRIESHEYDGPQGRGFELVVYTKVDGETYFCRKHVGPETHRDEGAGQWTRLVADAARIQQPAGR